MKKEHGAIVFTVAWMLCVVVTSIIVPDRVDIITGVFVVSGIVLCAIVFLLLCKVKGEENEQVEVRRVRGSASRGGGKSTR